ncbi:thioredoxin family protein [Roseofilum capinflatum]|uniref:Thioredoxin n=1 Tax=Roseofilum capinflatum BLCC-M114 TaxID=3022440 RepID=A0ABT7B3L3_9CYAN|nr:thioredoxin family protein [Roseofilum capinflatum]MDJ1173757.1 thioredoxin family protein [Roseofilum capinflatum BLCC-M114]
MVVQISERAFNHEVLDAQTPVLVNFWAPWCGICRLLNPVLSRFQTEWGQTLKVVSINADQSLKLANAYRLRTLPTVILFNQGRVQNRIEGFHSAEDLYRQLEVSCQSLSGTKTADAIDLETSR